MPNPNPRGDTSPLGELKPCPFCGGALSFYNVFGRGMGPLKTYTVKCFGCFLETGRQDTPNEAIAAWNRRSAPTRDEMVDYGAMAKLAREEGFTEIADVWDQKARALSSHSTGEDKGGEKSAAEHKAVIEALVKMVRDPELSVAYSPALISAVRLLRKSSPPDQPAPNPLPTSGE